MIITPSNFPTGAGFTTSGSLGSGVTLTRPATTATQINSSRLIENVSAADAVRWDYLYAGQNGATITRQNLIRNSNMVGAATASSGTFPTGWQINGNGNNGLSVQVVGTGRELTFNYVDLRFYGTASAFTYVGFYIEPAFTQLFQGQTITSAIYYKVVSGNFPTTDNIEVMQEMDGTLNNTVRYNTRNFTPTSTLTQLVWNVTAVNANCAAVRYYVQTGIQSGTTIDYTLRIAAPMLYYGSTAYTYLGTTGSIAQAISRGAGLLAEPTRRNDFTRSNDWSISYNPTNTTMIANRDRVVDPTGITMTASSFVFNGPINFTYQTQNQYAVGDNIMVSLYFKNINYSGTFQFYVGAGTSTGGRSARITVDKNTVVLGNGDTTSIIQDVGLGWFRIMFPYTATTAHATNITMSTVGNSYSGQQFLLWGRQSELGTSVTSYIPTTNAPVTRSGDNVSLDWLSRGVLDGSFPATLTMLDGTTQQVTMTSTNGTALLPTDQMNKYSVTAISV